MMKPPDGINHPRRHAWFYGYNSRVNEEKDRVFEEGKQGHRLGLLANENPYSEKDVAECRVGTTTFGFPFEPQFSWAEGYASGLQESIDHARDENKEALDNCISKIKLRELEYIKNFEAAIYGNVFSHGLSDFKSKKICDNIAREINSDHALAVLKGHYFRVFFSKDGIEVSDASEYAINAINCLREEPSDLG